MCTHLHKPHSILPDKILFIILKITQKSQYHKSPNIILPQPSQPHLQRKPPWWKEKGTLPPPAPSSGILEPWLWSPTLEATPAIHQEPRQGLLCIIQSILYETLNQCLLSLMSGVTNPNYDFVTLNSWQNASTCIMLFYLDYSSSRWLFFLSILYEGKPRR